MSKVHYATSNGEEESYSERAMCGVRVGENYQYDNHWANVSCKLCIKNRTKIESCVNSIESDVINQLGDMANFMRNENVS